MPKIGTHAIVTNEQGQVLLVRKNYLDHDWIPPGGVMEEGESISATVAREVREETGFIVEIAELVTVGSRAKTNDVIIVVAAKIVEKSNTVVDPTEIAEVGFFSFDKLPEPMKPEAKKLLEMYRQGIRGKLLEIGY